MGKEKQKKKNGATVQSLIGIKGFTEYGLLTTNGEMLFFTIIPTNISVLSYESVENKVRKLTLALSAVPDVEIACVDSAERFDDNKAYLEKRAESEKNVDKTAGVFQIQIPIRCAECGGQMIRKFDCRRKRKTKWVCKNPACKKETFISDEETLARLTKIINGIISNPETIGEEQEKEKTSVNEFNYADRDAVVKNISKLYSAIDEKAAMSERVKDILKDMSHLIGFSAEVLFDIADEVQINENGMVSIKLINGQIVGG